VESEIYSVLNSEFKSLKGRDLPLKMGVAAKYHYWDDPPEHRFEFDYDMVSEMEPYQYDDRYRGFRDMTVNQVGAKDQEHPQIAVDDSGDFVVVWQTKEEGNWDIKVGGFSRGGWRRFHDFQVNDDTEGDQHSPAIAMNPAGDFVVVWKNVKKIHAKSFAKVDNKKAPHLWPESDENEPTTLWGGEMEVASDNNPSDPDVAMNEHGDFVVVWKDDRGIHAKGFARDGTQSFFEQDIGTGDVQRPRVAMDAAGNFVVVWEKGGNIGARQFNKGNHEWKDLPLAHGSDGAHPDVAMNANGDFVVVKHWYHRVKKSRLIRAIRFPMGDPSPGWELVADYRDAEQPEAAMDSDGNLVVVWQYHVGERSGQVGARSYDAHANQWKDWTTVNADLSGKQHNPSVALDRSNRVVVAWEDDIDKDGGFQILARGSMPEGRYAHCSSDIGPVPNYPGECGAEVTWEETTSLTGGDIEQIYYDPPGYYDLPGGEKPSGYFDVGQTTVESTVTFEDQTTAACSFEVEVEDVEAPTIHSKNYEVDADPGVCYAVVEDYEVSIADNCEYLPPYFNPPLGDPLPLGPTEVTCTVFDEAGNLAEDSFEVTVVDTQPPVLSNCRVTPKTLWPPNHKMVDVEVQVTISENCSGTVTLAVEIDSNEPVNGKGDGNTDPDWEIVSTDHDAGLVRLRLRAERAGKGGGRVYEITVVGTDVHGNTSAPVSSVVRVPKSWGDGWLFHSTFENGSTSEWSSIVP